MNRKRLPRAAILISEFLYKKAISLSLLPALNVDVYLATTSIIVPVGIPVIAINENIAFMAP